MDDLVQWLTACLDEDERLARATRMNKITAHVSFNDTKSLSWGGDHDTFSTEGMLAPLAEHIAAHDPARVLREVEAKRRIVDRYAWLREHGDTGGTAWVLPLLALPYADRPGYREEWRP